MGRDSGRLRPQIAEALAAIGCAAAGFCPASPISRGADTAFRRWLADGCRAGMAYLDRHADLRLTPESALPGVRAVISLAFRFPRPDKPLPVAAYALGRNYHKAINSAVRPLVETLRRHGATARVCIDSAPVAERYWAVRAGIATIGRNGMALVSGCGPYAFLCEVLTDLDLSGLPPYLPCGSPPACTGCNACVRACPAGALRPDATLDARRCLSYLSIEHRGPVPSPPSDGAYAPFPLLGCDRCLSACPLGRDSQLKAPILPDLLPRPEIAALTPERVLGMTDAELDALTAGTSLRRPGLEGLRRNARLNISARRTVEKKNQNLSSTMADTYFVTFCRGAKYTTTDLDLLKRVEESVRAQLLSSRPDIADKVPAPAVEKITDPSLRLTDYKELGTEDVPVILRIITSDY